MKAGDVAALGGNHPNAGQRRYRWFQQARQRIPRSNAYAAAAVREPTPSLVKMLLTCRSASSSCHGSRQSQETAGLKGANVPDELFFQIHAWSAKKAGISY
jgi:hypothetical protein